MERRYAICNSCSYSIFPIVPKKQTSDICLFEICNGICDMFVLGNIRLYFFYSYYDVIGWFKILIIPVFSIYSGFVLHLLKSKKKKVFFLSP